MAKQAEAVALGDVIGALQGPVEVLLSLDEQAPIGRRRRRTPTHNSGHNGPVPAADDVPAQVWRELVAKVALTFNGVTLQDLVSRAEDLGVKRAAATPLMYFI